MFVREWSLPLIGSGRANGNGASIKCIQIALMPGSIAKDIRSAGTIVGNGSLVCHRDLTNGLSGAVLFLASDNGGVILIAYAGAEVEDQSEAAKGFCMWQLL